jgi:hypothetical protein
LIEKGTLSRKVLYLKLVVITAVEMWVNEITFL